MNDQYFFQEDDDRQLQSTDGLEQFIEENEKPFNCKGDLL